MGHHDLTVGDIDMNDLRSRARRWAWIIALSPPLAIACDSSQSVAPPSTAESGSELLEMRRGGMSDAALFVGNFSPPPGLPTNGILRYDGTGTFIDNMVPEGTAGMTIACCMTFGPDENLYVSSPLTSSIYRFHGVTGAFIDEFVPPGSGGLVVPLILVFHDGKLYVGDVGTRAILRYNATTGAFIDVFVKPADNGGMGDGDPQDYAFGPDGNLYVSSYATDRVLRFHRRTGAFIDEFIGSDAVNDPGGLIFGPRGDLYVTSGNGVNRYNSRTGALKGAFVTQGSGGLFSPVGIRFGPDRNLYVASLGPGDVGEGEILRYDRKGRFIDSFVPTGRGGMSGPRVIEFKSTITICHQRRGEHKDKTITIGYLSASEHVAHGDALGRCR